MEAGWLARARWRRRGAWMWPAFLGLTTADAVLGHLLPVGGGSENIVAAALIGCFANLLAIVALAWPVSLVLRRRRGDLPRVVARDYAATSVMAALTVLLLAAGLVHHGAIARERRVEREAMVRAAAWIGTRAPARFRRNAGYVDSYAIVPGSIYRECVPDRAGHEFCVIVRTERPAERSVSFAGYEPNWVFSQGTR